VFKPELSLSKKLLSTLLEVERLYGKLESEHVPSSLLLNLEERNLVLSSFSSTKIEGNPMTRAQVTNLILNDRVPANRDEKEVRNYFDILTDLPEYSKSKIDVPLTLKIHKRLLTGVDDEIAGKFRNQRVVVGSYAWDTREKSSLVIKHDPPYHTSKQISHAISELSKWLEVSEEQGIIKAGIFHQYFQFFHPFVDGNGRVGRILTAMVLHKNNYKINKYFVLDDYYDIDRVAYSDKLHSADYSDMIEWLEYFVEGVKYSLQSALGRIEVGLRDLDIDLRPTNREKEVLNYLVEHRQVTTSDISDKFGVTRQQAHRLLSSLVEKGFIEKVGETKGSFYVIM